MSSEREFVLKLIANISGILFEHEPPSALDFARAINEHRHLGGENNGPGLRFLLRRRSQSIQALRDLPPERISWAASEYYGAQTDPLADTAADIIQRMNTDHGDGLVLLAEASSGIESQEMTTSSVDHLGFHVRLKMQDRMRSARIAFLREVSSSADARQVLVEMVTQARRM
jgi:hypothetical protein